MILLKDIKWHFRDFYAAISIEELARNVRLALSIEEFEKVLLGAERGA